MVAGAGAVQSLAVLPGTALRLVAGAACLLLAWVARRWRKGAAGVLAVLAAGLLAGALNAMVRAQWRLDDALADEHQDAVARLVLRVAELPDADARGVRFTAEQAGPGLPGV
ncbi:DUF4131 domain-containing protein, partial [Achromobacter xylosoxidans]